MIEKRIPVYGYDSLSDIRRAVVRQYGDAQWKENPQYVGPRSLTDQKGFNDIRGWLIVEEKDDEKKESS